MASLPAPIVEPSPASLPALVAPSDLIDMFLSGRNPRTMAAYGRDLDDFSRFVGATDRRSAVESLLSAGQGPANAWGLDWRNETAATKGKGAGKGRGGKQVRKVTERVIRTTAGTRVTLENRKGLDVPSALAAIREAAAKLEAELGGDQAAA